MKKIKFNKPLIISCITDDAKILQDALHQKDDIIIDLANIEDCDTAGVQLLISAQKTANQDKQAFSIENAPDVVQSAFFRAGIEDMNAFLTTEL